MALTRVFEPIRIRNLVVPNRVVRTAHDDGFDRGTIGDRFIHYQAERAKGGGGVEHSRRGCSPSQYGARLACRP
jgi:2,4-dienoyl-CoA reductase-like NADH-dependent reductase (Old Yellow Enzyme family)